MLRVSFPRDNFDLNPGYSLAENASSRAFIRGRSMSLTSSRERGLLCSTTSTSVESRVAIHGQPMCLHRLLSGTKGNIQFSPTTRNRHAEVPMIDPNRCIVERQN